MAAKPARTIGDLLRMTNDRLERPIELASRFIYPHPPILRRSAPVHPALNGTGIDFAAGACAWVAVDLWCPATYVLHLLLGHLLPMFLLALAGAMLGRLLLPPR